VAKARKARTGGNERRRAREKNVRAPEPPESRLPSGCGFSSTPPRSEASRETRNSRGSRGLDARAAHLLVQPEAVRLIGPVHDVLQVLSHELEELLEHLLNLGFLERTHDDKLCRAPPPSITWTRTRADVTPRPPKECREGYLVTTASCLYFNPRAARVWARLVSACLCVGGGGWSET
jgi:hypothetical protein